MSLDDLNSKSLIVSLWDEDSKSRDDYMAGVCVFMKTALHCFLFLVKVEFGACSILPAQRFGLA